MLFITYTSVQLVTIGVTVNGAEAIIKYSPFPFVPVLTFHIKGRLVLEDSGRHCCFSVFLIKSYTTESRDMGYESGETKQTNKGRKLDRLLSTSSLLLSVLCCIAIIHVELRTQEHHRLISHSTSGNFRDEMETEILRKVQLEYGRWREAIVSHLEGEWQRTRSKLCYFLYSWLLFAISISARVVTPGGLIYKFLFVSIWVFPSNCYSYLADNKYIPFRSPIYRKVLEVTTLVTQFGFTSLFLSLLSKGRFFQRGLYFRVSKTSVSACSRQS